MGAPAVYVLHGSLLTQENKEIEELEGVVEMDETYIDGKLRKMNEPRVGN